MFLVDTKDTTSVVFVEGSEDKYSVKNNKDGGGGEVSWYINVSNIILYLWYGNNLMIVINLIYNYIGKGRRRLRECCDPS